MDHGPKKWEICSSYFAEAIYDDPVSNQYNVNVDCLYENEKKNYGFILLKGLKKYHIDTVQQFYVYPDKNNIIYYQVFNKPVLSI